MNSNFEGQTLRLCDSIGPADEDLQEWMEIQKLWRPWEAHGWTWIQTALPFPETYSILDDRGELIGCVYLRWDVVNCRYLYTWGETVYQSQVDSRVLRFDDERERHRRGIGEALTRWVESRQTEGADMIFQRDDAVFEFETCNGHHPVMPEERDEQSAMYRRHFEGPLEALDIDDWKAERCMWPCEGYRLRDPEDQIRGQIQVRYGVVRAVACTLAEGASVDPKHQGVISSGATRTCNGPILWREKVQSMANAFEDGEREKWIRKAIKAIEDTRV